MIPALRPVATPPPGCYPSLRRPDLGFDASTTGNIQSNQSLKIGKDLLELYFSYISPEAILWIYITLLFDSSF
jgi:hypothetical protein